MRGVTGSVGVGVIAVFTAIPAVAGAPTTKQFDEARFSFTFAYDAGWIPGVQVEGESVTFSLSEGEILVSAQRDPNPKHLKTRVALAEAHILTWKDRLDFSVMDKTETTLGSLPATLVTGTASLYDAPVPYKLALYVVERDGRLYVVKYAGLYDPSLPYWEGFNRMLKSFKFRES